MRVLIDTIPFDEHAAAIKWALERRGHQADLFYTSDFPAIQTLSARFEPQRGLIARNGPDRRLEGPYDRAVLRRRRGLSLSPTVHPSDQDFARAQAEVLADAAAELFDVRGAWINPPGSRRAANSKPLQLKHAQAAGLTIPPTLISNDPDEVCGFCAEQGGTVAMKPLKPGTWTQADGGLCTTFTTTLTLDELRSRENPISLTPAIYQAYVPKAHELRVVAMGRTCFAAQLESQGDPDTQLDWRLHYVKHKKLGVKRVDMSEAIWASCLRLMDALGIVFGSFDFVRRPDGELVFLEVNPMGQFLWLDPFDGFPMLPAFCDFLESGDPGFTWDGRVTEDLRYEQFRDSAPFRQLFDEEFPKHIKPSSGFVYADA